MRLGLQDHMASTIIDVAQRLLALANVEFVYLYNGLSAAFCRLLQ